MSLKKNPFFVLSQTEEQLKIDKNEQTSASLSSTIKKTDKKVSSKTNKNTTKKIPQYDNHYWYCDTNEEYFEYCNLTLPKCEYGGCGLCYACKMI